MPPNPPFTLSAALTYLGTINRIRTGIRVQPSEQGSTVHVGRIA